MNQYELKKAFLSGEHVYGTMVTSTSPRWVEYIVRTGIDFVFIDTEHMPMDRSIVSWMCQAYKANNIAPIVRISSPNPYDASIALDSGAVGIVAPYLETTKEVNDMRGVVKYRPLKGKRLHAVLEGEERLSVNEEKYLKEYNDGHLLILNIESRYAVDNLDELLKMPDVDAVFIGPHDLSINLGIPEQYDNHEFEKYVERVIRKCRAHSIGVGNHFSGDIEKQIQWAKMGMNIIIWNVDVIRFTQIISNDIAYIKSMLL